MLSPQPTPKSKPPNSTFPLDIVTPCVIIVIVIQSFHDSAAENVWNLAREPRYGADLQRMANKKMIQLNSAGTLNDLRIPPGNRLEKLQGNREGQHSIRINDQYRICFTWTDDGPTDVEITDYH